MRKNEEVQIDDIFHYVILRENTNIFIGSIQGKYGHNDDHDTSGQDIPYHGNIDGKRHCNGNDDRKTVDRCDKNNGICQKTKKGKKE
jgi:hypothetical protein